MWGRLDQQNNTFKNQDMVINFFKNYNLDQSSLLVELKSILKLF